MGRTLAVLIGLLLPMQALAAGWKTPVVLCLPHEQMLEKLAAEGAGKLLFAGMTADRMGMEIWSVSNKPLYRIIQEQPGGLYCLAGSGAYYPDTDFVTPEIRLEMIREKDA